MINREEYLDDHGLQVDPLFDMVDEYQSKIEQLKKENEDMLTMLTVVSKADWQASNLCLRVELEDLVMRLTNHKE